MAENWSTRHPTGFRVLVSLMVLFTVGPIVCADREPDPEPIAPEDCAFHVEAWEDFRCPLDVCKLIFLGNPGCDEETPSDRCIELMEARERLGCDEEPPSNRCIARVKKCTTEIKREDFEEMCAEQAAILLRECEATGQLPESARVKY